MSLSFIIWFSISAFLLGFWIWTLYIIYKQNKAWKAYADKKKLRYYSNGFYNGSSMSGAIDGYKVSIFTSEHAELDARSQKRLSAIEINLHSTASVFAGIASGGMVNLVETFDMHQEFKPHINKWDDSYIIRTRNLTYMQKYLNDERLTKLINLMEEKNIWVILLLSDNAGLLRLDTPMPIDHPKQMNDLVNKLIDVARVLELKDGEDDTLLSDTSDSNVKQKTLVIDGDILDDDTGLELEE